MASFLRKAIEIAGAAALLLSSSPAAAASQSLGQPVTVSNTETRLVVSNGFVRIELDASHPSFDCLYSDPTGGLPAASSPISNSTLNLFGIRDSSNLNRHGIVFEIDYFDPSSSSLVETASSSGSLKPSPSFQIQILESTPQLATVLISNIITINPPIAIANWQISLQANSKIFDFSDSISISSSSLKIASIRTSFYLLAPSITGLFARGVVQMMNSPNLYFSASDTSLEGVYNMAENKGSIYLHPLPSSSPAPQYVLLSNSASSPPIFGSGIQIIHVGNYTSSFDEWDSNGWSQAAQTSIQIGESYSLNAQFSANVHDFPIVTDQDFIRTIPSNGIQDFQAGDQAYDDFRTFQTSLYGGCVGSLVTYQVPHVGSPTIASPDRAYSPLYSFYDPDNWLTVVALSYSGVPYLQEQARLMLESHLSKMLPNGQLPHHFIGDVSDPTYLAISGATQTGPNVFWTLAALSYARNSGNSAWIQQHLNDLQLTLGFLLDMIDPHYGLLSSPGPLFIDVFIRNNFTTDSNAALVLLLNEFSDMEAYFGYKDLANKHRLLAANITQNMNTYLFSQDHFITQYNPDGSIRDFIDYDANFIAITAGILSNNTSLIQKVVKRIDSGSCTRKGRATWVSEKFYDANNCYNGNTGDSQVTMGRIAYFDAHSHVINNQIQVVEDEIYTPLMKDLFEMTYLPERYTCDGVPTHNMNMHEYTELLVMLLREIIYGINIKFDSLVIQPYLRQSFEYQIGNVYVRYTNDNVIFNVPADGNQKQVKIYGVLKNQEFDVEIAKKQGGPITHLTVTSDAEGLLDFSAPISSDYTFTIRPSASFEELQ